MSTLWLVATPIGNLGDLPPRAVEVLSHVALICCEDTRRTGLLLQHAGVRAERLAVCNDHTELSRVADVLRTLGDGRDVASRQRCRHPRHLRPRRTHRPRGHRRRLHRQRRPRARAPRSWPSRSAGSPPTGSCSRDSSRARERDRADRLAEIAAEHRTTVIYEAPHRVLRTLEDLRVACGDDRVVGRDP